MEVNICDTKTISKNLDDDFQILQELYIKGDDIQKLSIIQSLPNLIQSNLQGTCNRIIPKIQQELPKSSCEVHIAASHSFRILIEQNTPCNLITTVLQGIESKDPIVSSSWIDTLLAVIPKLSASVIKNEVLSLALSKAQLNRPVYFRVSSCKMLGLISVHSCMSSFDVRKDVLPLAQSLCQDFFFEVRSAICLQLPLIAKGLDSEIVVKSNLLPNLVELASDENMSVRSNAIDAVALIIPHMSKDTVMSTIMPLLKQLCSKSMDVGDTTFVTISKDFGRLIDILQPNLSGDDNCWFLEFYQKLSKKGIVTTEKRPEHLDPGLGVLCREYCAQNLPIFTYFTMSTLDTHIEMWYTIFKDLAADPCYIVRKAVAGCIHEIAGILGKQNKIIKPDFVKLLRDDAEEVLESLVPNITETLDLFTEHGVLSRETAIQSTLDIGKAILKCYIQLFKGYSWRIQDLFLCQLERLPNSFPSTFIHQHFTPIIFNTTIDARAKPVRSQATRTLLVFLKYNTKEVQRKWLRDHLISKLCYSSCCYTRHIFIKCCVHAMDIFSQKYFKEYFFTHFISLADDPVSNIRLCTLALFPKLKNMLLLPLEGNLMVQMESYLTKIEQREKDKDVLVLLKDSLKKMKTTTGMKTDALQEERRKIQEEEMIEQGKILEMTRGSGKNNGNSVITNTYHIPRKVSSKTNSGRSASAPSKSVTSTTSSGTSDMSFLEQHFYIDAGINLPEKITSNPEDEVPNFKQELLLPIDRVIPNNITDDDKVNLKKNICINDLTKSASPYSACNIPKTSSNVKIRPKRYSSVYSLDCIENKNKNNVLNRRSLNINSSEISRIPICFKAAKKEPESNVNMRKSKSETTKLLYKNQNESSDIVRMSFLKTKQRLKSEFGGSGKKESIRNIPNSEKSKIKLSDCDIKESGQGNSKENLYPIKGNGSNIVPNSHRTTKENLAKGSNLPVLKRRSQSEARK